MATYTDNYHLEKPAQSDLYNVDVFNDNSDIIDAALASKALAQNQATIESTSSASRNYAKGEFLVYNGLLYKVTAAISSGGTIAPGTNCTATNTGTELKALNDSLTPKSNFMLKICQGTITDSSYGFIDTGISSNNYIILCAYILTASNQYVHITNLQGGGNFRIQIYNATDNSIYKSGGYTAFVYYVPRSMFTEVS